MTDEQRESLLDTWEAAAPGWARQADRTRTWLEPLSDWMLRRAALTPGTRVVELAAGPGDLSLLAAPLVAPAKILCSDGVKAMVDAARERAEDYGVQNIEFAQLQLEWIDLPAASAEVILCRLGLMLCVDPPAALQECRRVLQPEGRLVLGVWDRPELNEAFSLPRELAADLGLMAPLDRGTPGPYSLAEPERLKDLLDEAGFFDVEIEPVSLTETYRNELDWLGTVVDRSPSFGEMWRGLRDGERVALRGALRDRAEHYAQPDGSYVTSFGALAAVAQA